MKKGKSIYKILIIILVIIAIAWIVFDIYLAFHWDVYFRELYGK